VAPAGAPAPDLRESKIALDPEAFWSVVRDGALLPKGMPKYSYLTRKQDLQIYSYIQPCAREVLADSVASDPTAEY